MLRRRKTRKRRKIGTRRRVRKRDLMRKMHSILTKEGVLVSRPYCHQRHLTKMRVSRAWGGEEGAGMKRHRLTLREKMLLVMAVGG